MTIIFLILKILGIAILVLLGILFLFLFLALFFPVGYSICGISEEDVKVKGKIYWLFHMISFCFTYQNKESATELRIFGKRIGKKAQMSEKQEQEVDEPADQSEEENTENPADQNEEKNTENPADQNEEKNTENQANLTNQSNEETDEPIKEKEEQALKPVKKKKRKKGIFYHIRKKYQDFCEKIRKIKSIIKDIKEKGASFKNTLFAPENRDTVHGILKEVKYLLKHFRFRKLRSELSFSMGDPSITGLVLGGLSMFPFLYQTGVHIYPDFEQEEEYIKGEMEAKGHIRGIHILLTVIRLWKDDNLKKLIKNFTK